MHGSLVSIPVQNVNLELLAHAFLRQAERVWLEWASDCKFCMFICEQYRFTTQRVEGAGFGVKLVNRWLEAMVMLLDARNCAMRRIRNGTVSALRGERWPAL